MVARTVAAGPVLRVQQPPAMILMPAPRCFFEKTDRKKMKRSLYFFFLIHTVARRNPAPVDRWFIPFFLGFQPSKLQDFCHPQYTYVI
jgi:hypothetical protein